MLRDLILTDLPKLDEIHQSCQSFPVPRLSNIITDRVAENASGEIIGYGLVKLFPEAIMILDTRKPLRQRVEALNELLQHAIGMTKEHGAEQLHVFVEDEKFSHLLIERYGFNTVNAKALVLNME